MGDRYRTVLYIIYVISFALMVCDILFFDVVEQKLFYVGANGILIFRLFGVWVFPWLVHVGCAIYLVYYFAFIRWELVNFFNTILMSIPVYIAAITALHLVFFRPGRNVNQRACRAGIHALIGIVVMVHFFWGIVFLINDLAIQGILEMFYFLLWLFMILNPKFLEKTQIPAIAQVEADAEAEWRDFRRESRRESRRASRDSLRAFRRDSQAQLNRPEGGQDTETQQPRNRR